MHLATFPECLSDARQRWDLGTEEGTWTLPPEGAHGPLRDQLASLAVCWHMAETWLTPGSREQTQCGGQRTSAKASQGQGVSSEC